MSGITVLALVFLAFIFYVGLATLPLTLTNISHLISVGETNPGILETRDRIDGDYRDMLNLKGTFLQNKGFYVDLNGAMARFMGQRDLNFRVKLNNGHLVELTPEKDLSVSAGQIIKTYRVFQQNGKAFLFVLAPGQVSKYENLLPVGFEDYSNQNADAFLALLRKSDVPVLDLRDTLNQDHINNAEAFFVTDHHWKPETGFYAYQKIVDYFVKAGAMPPVDASYLDLDQFNVQIYRDYFLGSSGKRTGSRYAGVDDLAIITPRFPTDISVAIPSEQLMEEGSFSDVCFDQNALKRDYFSSNPYSAYGHGDNDFTQYRNDFAPCSQKVLAWGDSFTDSTFTFLPIVFSSVDELDMRLYQDDFQQYYEAYDPDIIVALASVELLDGLNTTYDFFPDVQAQ